MKPDFDILSHNEDAIKAIMNNIKSTDRDHADFYIYEDTPDQIAMSGGRAYLLTVEYGKRIPDNVIHRYQRTGGAVFNIHRADPRKYAGASVLNHQILNGESIADVSLIRVRPNEPLDGGELLNMWPVNIKNMLYPEAVEECRLRYVHIVRYLLQYSKGNLQEAITSHKFTRRSPEDSELMLPEPEQRRIMAADNERFPAFFMLGGRKIILKAYPEAPPE